MTASRISSTDVRSGSPSTGGPDYLVVGVLRRTHGLNGGLVMRVITDFPEYLQPNTTVYVGDRHTPRTLRSVNPHNEGLVLQFLGAETPDAARPLRNQAVYVKAIDRPHLPAGQYYHHELLGFNVVTDDDVSLGVLTEILQTGANDVYVVAGTLGREILVPAIGSVVAGIDTNRRTVRIHPIPGLLDAYSE